MWVPLYKAYIRLIWEDWDYIRGSVWLIWGYCPPEPSLEYGAGEGHIPALPKST